jgi:prefoldin subunit 5
MSTADELKALRQKLRALRQRRAKVEGKIQEIQQRILAITPQPGKRAPRRRPASKRDGDTSP